MVVRTQLHRNGCTGRRPVAAALLAGLSCLAGVGQAAEPAGLHSLGNVDGVLTWDLGTVAAGGTARQVVLLVYDDSPEALASRLAAARAEFASLPPFPAAKPDAPAQPKVWVRNAATDFALEGPCFFRWRLERQSLTSAQGGQLSQFTYYLHYRDSAGEHRAGVPQDGDSTPENLGVAEPVRAVSETQLAGAVQTSDGKLRADVRAMVGTGSVVAVEFVLTNLHTAPLEAVRLSTYANLESAHSHEGDFSQLDARTASLFVLDPPTQRTVAMAGLTAPSTGYSGVWNSFAKLQAAEGVPFGQWQAFAGLPPDLVKRLEREQASARGYYLPFAHPNPNTPPTRALTPAEAQDARVRDWLFQAAGQPWAERALQEIEWTRDLAARLTRAPATPDLTGDLRRLYELRQRLLSLPQAERNAEPALALYLAVREAKRRITFANPVLDFSQLLFIDQPYPRGPVNDIHEAIHRMGITATPGGRLLVLTGLDPGGAVRQLAPDRPGSFWRPDLSFDAARVVFCYKAQDDRSFHLYEIGLDGRDLRQLTHGDYDDVDPLYLPDGHLLFTSTRGNSYVRCGPFIYSYTLARCDADGRNVYLISQNGEPDFVPALLADGRVAYSRWEYSDKPLWRVQSLWTTNQDGTGTAVLWGNQSVWPDHLSEPRPIPGSRRIMFSGVGHHDWWSGSIGIIDPERGSNYPNGLTKVTADLRWPECSLPPADPVESPAYHAAGAYTGYKTPYPLGERDFLVSARGADGRFRLYLMDMDGNRELIYEGVHNVLHAIPVKPRPVPPCQPDRVAWPGTGTSRRPAELGSFYCADVYEGVPDLARGRVRYLRVFQLDHKTYSTWAKTYRHSGPPVSIVQEEGVKRILSEVEVATDGSVYFQVVPGRALFFQLLDADRRCLQTMRSFTGVLPGEVRGCLGCHEQHRTAPPRKAGLALRRPPQPLSPPPWGTESIGYERFAQPVLDRYCGRCHQGAGEARTRLDLTLRPGQSVFKEPYLTLVGGAGWGNPVAAGSPGYGIAGAIPVESMDPTMNDPRAYATLRPNLYLSAHSALVEHASSGTHHGVQADELSLRRLMAWVDACCPFMGEEELRALGDPEFAGIEELPVRPRVATAPVIERP